MIPAAASEDDAVRLGVVVLAHTNADQVALLLSTLRHPDVRLFLHVDGRRRWAPFARALEAKGVGDVVRLPPRPTRWGGPEVVDATVDGLRTARRAGCDYVVLLSGQDFPLWPVERILAFFTENRHRSFVEHFPLPDPRWRVGGRLRTECYTFTVRGRRETHVPPGFDVPMSWKGRILNALLGLRTLLRPRRGFPDYLRPYGGSQWWNLTAAAADHVLGFLERHPDYRRYHEHTLVPDEIFFQSILAGTPFADEHEVVNDPLRYMQWPENGSHPGVLATPDLPALQSASQPFARKFDADLDAGVLAALSTAAGSAA